MPLPHLTQDLPGSGGSLKLDVADFRVDEVLAYAPSGAGDHRYLRVEKIGLTTLEAVERVARALGVSPGDVGYAGLKDKRATTTQWLSAPRRPGHLDDLGPGLRVLDESWHTNKIRRGHTRANRFRIVVRGTVEGGAERAAAVLARLSTTGVPNYFGEQRFGRDGANVAEALEWLRGVRRPPRSSRIRDLQASAVQSEAFNRVLALRIERGLLGRALAGDVMQKHATGGLFEVQDPATEQPRVDRLEISPTGPLPGKKTRAAGGEALALELEAIAPLGLGDDEIARLGPGTRRTLRYPLPADTRLERLETDAYAIEVELPSGAYATVLLAELTKGDGRDLEGLASDS